MINSVWLRLGILALVLLALVGCASPTAPSQPVQSPPAETQPPQQPELPPDAGGQVKVAPQDEAQRIAVGFLRNSPTFRFDGIESTLKLVSSEAGAKPNSWIFHYEFQCRQAGYGDRTGMILAQVITDHRAEIVVEEGKVVSAVLDGRWDELNQKAQ